MIELEEIVRRYGRRSGLEWRYSMFNADVWLSAQERQRAMIRCLANHVPIPPENVSLLEIGCGSGGHLLELIRLGFDPGHLVANELLPRRAAVARRNLPAVCDVIEGDASALNFEAGRFDVVYQSMVFSSILDSSSQEQLARRMWYWVKPGGGIIWHDFIYDNPSNPDVRGISIRTLRKLFPEAAVETKRITLAPPISRRLSRFHPAAYHVLNAIPWLRTHVLCWLGKEITGK